ncbi:hypothetical protein ACOME3_005712 [Neoechinorhynchus agilis]
MRKDEDHKSLRLDCQFLGALFSSYYLGIDRNSFLRFLKSRLPPWYPLSSPSVQRYVSYFLDREKRTHANQMLIKSISLLDFHCDSDYAVIEVSCNDLLEWTSDRILNGSPRTSFQVNVSLCGDVAIEILLYDSNSTHEHTEKVAELNFNTGSCCLQESDLVFLHDELDYSKSEECVNCSPFAIHIAYMFKPEMGDRELVDVGECSKVCGTHPPIFKSEKEMRDVLDTVKAINEETALFFEISDQRNVNSAQTLGQSRKSDEAVLIDFDASSTPPTRSSISSDAKDLMGVDSPISSVIEPTVLIGEFNKLNIEGEMNRESKTQDDSERKTSTMHPTPSNIHYDDPFSSLLKQYGLNRQAPSDRPSMLQLQLSHQKRDQDDPVKTKINHWANGRRLNIRALLSTLHTVLWDEAKDKWQPLNATLLNSEEKIKKAYRKAVLVVHPDKITDDPELQRWARLVFMELSEAWSRFELESATMR